MIPEADDDGSLHENPHEPSGRPGTRAPTSPSTPARRSTSSEATSSSSPRRTRVVSCGGRAPRSLAHRIETPAFAEAYGTGTEGAVLVRPDGFIAWRARGPQQDGERELSSALARILDR